MPIDPEQLAYLKARVEERCDAFHVEDRDRCTRELADAAEALILEIERLQASGTGSRDELAGDGSLAPWDSVAATVGADVAPV